jgi:hypothetical protein
MGPINYIGFMFILGGLIIGYCGFLVSSKNKLKYGSICQQIKHTEVKDKSFFMEITSKYHMFMGLMFTLMGVVLQFVKEEFVLALSCFIFFFMLLFIKASIESKIIKAEENFGK